MSEVKVNKISPRTNCGTVTLGDSGDTFTIPAGATITNNGTAAGFGATGAASWDTTVKTGDFTAVSGVGYFVNTTSGEIDVTLPAGSPGAVVAVKDYAKTWDTNNCVIISNGSEKIGGSTNNAILSTEGLAVTFIYIDSTQGWLVTDDGLQSVASTNPFMVATGGTITTSGNCKIHTFTGPGTFTVCRVATSAPNNQVSYMVVAGGGAGGARKGGGGGAGGFREDQSPVTPYTASPLEGAGAVTVTAQGYPIVVGGGGTGSVCASQAVNPGNDSSALGKTATKGGGGGTPGSAAPNNPCNSSPGAGDWGGSGGGVSDQRTNTAYRGQGNKPPVSPAQGSDGGMGVDFPPAGGGGGGGATAVGVNATSPGGPSPANKGGNGGAGATTSITGSPVVYAGGGGGGINPGGSGAGTGGSGGGGAGAVGPNGVGTAATANTGGGGGGGGSDGCSNAGGNGGSGIVVIRYKYQ